MRIYENKDELKNEINKSFAKYISEFNDIPEPLKDKRKERVFRSKLPPIILSGISLVNYINGSQIHMHTCHCKS